MTRKIITRHRLTPLPWRKFDWTAFYEGEEELGLYGYGETEAEAIAELKSECPDEDDNGLDAGNRTPESPAQLSAR